jgi:ATP-dependent Clp protease ATP-binding subunit ClpX
MENVGKVVVDESVIAGDNPPYIVFEGVEKQVAVSD